MEIYLKLGHASYSKNKMKLQKLQNLGFFLWLMSIHVCHDSFSVLNGMFFPATTWQRQKQKFAEPVKGMDPETRMCFRT